MAEDDRNTEIRIDRVPVGRGLGTALAIIVLIGALLLELPALRGPTLAGAVGGVILGGVLMVWRRWRPASRSASKRLLDTRHDGRRRDHP